MEHLDAQTAFDQLIFHFHKPIYRYCYHMLRHPEDAEDVTQEVFLKAYQSIDRLTQIRSHSAWLYKIAHNQCVNLIRKKRLFRFIPYCRDYGNQTQNDRLLIHFEDRLAIDRVLSTLNSLDRSIILLRVLEDKTYEEIGTIINAKPSYVRKRFERAKNKILQNFTFTEGVLENEQSNIPIF